MDRRPRKPSDSDRPSNRRRGPSGFDRPAEGGPRGRDDRPPAAGQGGYIKPTLRAPGQGPAGGDRPGPAGSGFKPRFDKATHGKPGFSRPKFGKPDSADGPGPKRPERPQGPSLDSEAVDRQPARGPQAERPRFTGPGPRKGKFYGGSNTVPSRPEDFESGEPQHKFQRKMIKTPMLRIVHEDADLVVIDKPTNTPTAGVTGSDAQTLLQALKEHLKDNATKIPRRVLKEQQFLAEERGMSLPDRTPPIGVIHRLDKEASGLVVFSKSEKAFHWLKDDFKTRRAKRSYIAVVEGSFGPVGKQGTLSSLLVEQQDGTVHSVDPSRAPQATHREGDDSDTDNTPKLATTLYTVLHVGEGRSMLKLQLHTGRKHQIRVHLSEAGHPIIGDERYGARTDPLKRLALHAAELSFVHPATGKPSEFHAPVPPTFYRAVGVEAPPESFERIQASAPGIKQSRAAATTAWENVATWYDAMIDEQRNDHYANVIIPGTLRLIEPAPRERILDVACGQGVIARELAQLGCNVVGVDAAPGLIASAKARSKQFGPATRYITADATKLGDLDLEKVSFDKAVCVMAIANIDPLEPVFRSVAELLKPGGSFITVFTHPAFRAHGQSAWGWDAQSHSQYRRVDGYLSHGSKPIQMHPGGAPDVVTTSFHRPLQTYVRVLAEAGFAVSALQEWPALRVSQPGPRAEAENRARREIPLFLALRAIKLPG